jgi:hypothetical protein
MDGGSMAAQIYTLVGVAVGAIASYSVSALNERERYRSELRRGWAEKRLEIGMSLPQPLLRVIRKTDKSRTIVVST